MSRNTGKNSKPEALLRKALWRMGLRYRLHEKLPGKPDIYFAGAAVAVFVDGCFWHKCPIHFQAPVSNAEFWQQKIEGNVNRDIKVNAQLSERGILPFRVWEHEIKEDLTAVAEKIYSKVSDRT